jgi:hypothetical protein
MAGDDALSLEDELYEAKCQAEEMERMRVRTPAGLTVSNVMRAFERAAFELSHAVACPLQGYVRENTNWKLLCPAAEFCERHNPTEAPSSCDAVIACWLLEVEER